MDCTARRTTPTAAMRRSMYVPCSLFEDDGNTFDFEPECKSEHQPAGLRLWPWIVAGLGVVVFLGVVGLTIGGALGGAVAYSTLPAPMTTAGH